MNLARMFAYTRQLEQDLERERAAHALTRREAREDRQKLIDGLQNNAGRRAVYHPPPIEDASWQRKPALGPTRHADRELMKRAIHERANRQPTESEIEAAAAQAVGEPKPPNGDAEPAEPIVPGASER